MSEAEHLVDEARKSMGDSFAGATMDAEGVAGADSAVTKEIIREEEEKEAGPEVDPEGLKHVAARQA